MPAPRLTFHPSTLYSRRRALEGHEPSIKLPFESCDTLTISHMNALRAPFVNF